MRRPAGLALGLVALTAASAGAQVSAFVDVASGNASFDGGVAASILTLSPSLTLTQPRWSIGANGTYTSFDGGEWSGQGSLAASWYGVQGGPFVVELAGRGDRSFRGFGTNTGQALGIVRAHALGAGQGAWIGGGAGEAWQGQRKTPVTRVDAGVWTRGEHTRLSFMIARGSLTDSQVVGMGGNNASNAGSLPVIRRQGSYSEMAASFEWIAGPVEVLSTVARRGLPNDGPRMSWLVSGTYWLSPMVGVIAGAGRYSPDPWQAHPGGRFVTLSLRVGFQPAVRARLRAPHGPATPAGVSSFQVDEVGEGRWVLRVRAPLARQVEVTGDFTDWQPMPLSSLGDGTWAVTLPLLPGTYRLNLRVDGGPWAVPPGVGMTDDDFSGRVGVVIVSRG